MRKFFIISVLVVLILGNAFSKDFKFFMNGLDQHPELLGGFLPTGSGIGVNYEGLRIKEDNITQLQFKIRSGYLQRQIFQNAKTGKPLEYGEKIGIFDVFRVTWATQFSQGFANYNCMLLDVAEIEIGDNCMMAPNVAIYTVGHPVHPTTRNFGYEYAKKVKIGNNVWLGGNTVVCPGVTIGNNVVIGAGSVVTKNIPDWSIAAGNPCTVIREITEEDKRKLYKNEIIDNKAWEILCNQTE